MSTIKSKIITAIRNKRGRDGITASYFTGITQDQKITTFYSTGGNSDTLKHMLPDAFLVFAEFDMASRGEQNYVTITDKTGANIESLKHSETRGPGHVLGVRWI